MLLDNYYITLSIYNFYCSYFFSLSLSEKSRLIKIHAIWKITYFPQ